MIFTLVAIGLGVTAVGAVASVIGKEMESSSGKKVARKTLQSIVEGMEVKNYEHEQFHDGQIIVNDKARGIMWVVDENGGYSYHGYGLLSDVELIVDDMVEYQTSLSSATGRAIVGGVLAGGIGAVVGGVTGKKNSKKTINKVELIISYNDSDHPYSRITLLDSRHGEKLDPDSCERAYSSGLKWSKKITALMN